MNARSSLRALALLLLGGAICLAVLLILPPRPVPATAPDAEFSAARAMEHLEIIGRVPHPMGEFPARVKVRDFILEEVRDLGLTPEVQDTVGIRVSGPEWMLAGPVENVLVRLPGNDPDGSILLIAHYDSTPGGPGAGDNGSGVVTLLEILRALQAGPRLRHDVICLFPDGHEPGIIGTHAFVAQHPWVQQVRQVINMDTLRAGPPSIVVTLGSNGLWVPAFAEEAQRPAAVSFPFHLFPGGDSDLLPFVGTAVSAIGIIGAMPGLEHHTTLDLPENVNPGTVQQTGNQVLAMVRTLGNARDLDSTLTDRTYFPLLGTLIHYQVSWAVPLAGLACLLFAGALSFGFRRRLLKWRGVGAGFLAMLVSLALSVVLINLLWIGLQSLHPEYAYSSYRPRVSDDTLYVAGLLLLALATLGAATAAVRKRVADLDLVAGGLTIWFLAALPAAFLLPASSYLTSWVLLFSALALLWALVTQSRKHTSTLSGFGYLISGILSVLIWLPGISIVVFGGALSSGYMMLSMLVGLTSFLIVALVPVLNWIAGRRRWLLPALAALSGAGFLVVGNFLVGRDSPPAMVNSVGYWFNPANDEAYWVAFIGGARIDAHRTTEVQAAFPESMDARQTRLLANPVRRPYAELFPLAPPFSVFTSEAPRLNLDGLNLDIVTDDWVDGRRLVIVRFATSLHDRLYVIIQSPALSAVTLPHNERTVLTGVDEWWLRLDGMPKEGMEIRFEFSAKGPVTFHLVEEKTGLPTIADIETAPPPGTMQSPGEFLQGIPSDFTAIHRSFSIQ